MVEVTIAFALISFTVVNSFAIWVALRWHQRQERIDIRRASMERAVEWEDFKSEHSDSFEDAYRNYYSQKGGQGV